MPSGKPGTHNERIVVYTRFDPVTIKELDRLGADHPLKPERARLVEAAVQGYIEKYRLSGIPR